MHVDIHFAGTIDQIAEQYMDALEAINEWTQLNTVTVGMGFTNNVLTVTLPRREDYSLWVMTYKGPYDLHCGGWETV